MYKLFIQTVLPFLPVIILITSCTKALETEPELYVEQGTSIIDKRSADAALVGAYNSLSQNSNQGSTFRYIANLADDNIKWVGNSPTNREFDVHTIFATNGRVSELWAATYRTINIANNIIDIVPTISDQTFTKTDRDKYRGEAFFLRAFSYFDLARLWGNVPIQTAATKTAADAKGIGNSPRNVVYAQVQKDLDSAEALLPAVITRNRANKFTALALKARLFLYQEQWDEAEKLATTLIQTPGFALGKNYSDFFSTKNTAESIFEIDYTINNQNSWASNWFASNVNGGKREFLPTEEFIALVSSPAVGGDRTSLLLNVSGTTYGNMNFKTATGEDQVYALRLAEIYFIRAEARAEKSLPDLPGALQDLNTIRRRANVPVLTAVTDKDELVSKILHERRIELAYESHRWFDIIRKGLESRVLGITDPNKLLLPIPKQQILVNPSLVQNPGYN